MTSYSHAQVAGATPDTWAKNSCSESYDWGQAAQHFATAYVDRLEELAVYDDQELTDEQQAAVDVERDKVTIFGPWYCRCGTCHPREFLAAALPHVAHGATQFVAAAYRALPDGILNDLAGADVDAKTLNVLANLLNACEDVADGADHHVEEIARQKAEVASWDEDLWKKIEGDTYGAKTEEQTND